MSETGSQAAPAPSIAIISGEVSGDLVGADLARDLLALRPDLELWGIGSKRMAAAGVELLFDSSDWSAIGILESLKILPRLAWNAYPRTWKTIIKRRPAAVVLIDFGAFNIHLAGRVKPHGIPILYYFPPGSWKRKGNIKPNIAQLTDRIATPFPWSADRLRSVGANVEFVGHPLLDIVKPSLSKAAFAERFGLDPSAPIIGLLPGSRGFEVKYNTPAMLGAAQLIREKLTDAQFVFGLASPMARKTVEGILHDWSQNAPDAPGGSAERSAESPLEAIEETLGLRGGARLVTPEGVLVSADALKKRSKGVEASPRSRPFPPVVLTEGLTYDVMAHSDSLIACSGTATLEAALLGTPMIIIYRGSRIMEIEVKITKVRPEMFGLPNILAGRMIVPELVQHEASPEALADYTVKFIGDPAVRGEVKAGLAEVRNSLGTSGASQRTAKMVLEMAGLR